MNKAELDLRRRLSRGMGDRWRLTWHEDGRVNPGVPDLSFVMNDGNYETGWLELKVAKLRNSKWEVKIEPGQHQWMELHAGLVPAYFLVEAYENWVLVDGRYHNMLGGEVYHIDSEHFVPADDFSSLGEFLCHITDRRRDGI
jgi:hypothetical protein